MTTYPTPWETYNPQGGKRVYGQEAKCYEHALFNDKDEQVGKSIKGEFPYFYRDEFSRYGLNVKYRQYKNYVPKVRKPEDKERGIVRTETYDEAGNLIDLTVETRTIYKNSKGKYIKTRSSGNPRITYEHGDTHYIVIRPVRMVYGRGTANQRSYIRHKAMTPEEWEAAGQRVLGNTGV